MICEKAFACISAMNVADLLLTSSQREKTNTGGLANLLQLKIGAKMMLKIILDIQDRLNNDKTGNISHIEFPQSIVRKVYVNFFDEQAGLKVMRSSYLSRYNSWVSIERCEAEIPIKKGSAAPSAKFTQFPLILEWASTVYKV